MEKIKKTILQAVTTGTTVTGGTIIIPDLTAVYHLKVGLKQVGHDLGFFDAAAIPAPPPDETYYLLDDGGDILLDDNNDNLIFN